MDNDDRPVGRVLSRREALAVLAASGAGLLLAACMPGEAATEQPSATPAPAAPPALPEAGATGVTPAPGAAPMCVVIPEQTEGPYFVEENLNRSDIRSDPSDGSVVEGVPLALALTVLDVGNGCAPLAGALVDVWHCDARGLYSDVRDPNADTVGLKFLRGHQVTDENGAVQFTTIYPGWYPGRTVHIHFKVRTDPAAARAYELTSQLYLNDAVTDEVHARPPYAARGARTTRNEDDNLYRDGGRQLMLAVEPAAEGYAGAFQIGLQMG